MTWQLLLAGFLILGTASYLLRRDLAVTFTEHNRLVNGVFFLGFLFPLGLVAALFSSPNLTIGWFNLFLLIAGSVAFPIINLLAYRANKDVDAGLYTILSNMAPVVTIAVAWILLNERLNGQQLLGALIILASAVLISLPQLRSRSASNRRGLLIASVSIVVLGLAIVFERYMLTRIDFGAYLVYGWGAQALWMSIFAWPERHNIKLLISKKYRARIAGYGATNALRGLCFVGALSLSGNVSLVTAFASFLSVLVVVSAFVILKERDWLWLKIGTAMLGSAGLIVLNLG